MQNLFLYPQWKAILPIQLASVINSSQQEVNRTQQKKEGLFPIH